MFRRIRNRIQLNNQVGSTRPSSQLSIFLSLPLFLIFILQATAEPKETPGGAQRFCTVPGTHLSIQAAVEDPACETVKLTSALYLESVTVSRSLRLVGNPSTIRGTLTISGDETMVEVDGLELAEPLIFSDGFESGDTSAWSRTVQ